MPPATTTSASPSATAWAPAITALSPEPHTLLSVQHGVASGRPAYSAAWRAGACPSPACSTLPRITSSTSEGETPARASASRTATAPSRVAGTDEREPRKEPTGVRAAATTTTSRPVIGLT